MSDLSVHTSVGSIPTDVADTSKEVRDITHLPTESTIHSVISRTTISNTVLVILGLALIASIIVFVIYDYKDLTTRELIDKCFICFLFSVLALLGIGLSILGSYRIAKACMQRPTVAPKAPDVDDIPVLEATVVPELDVAPELDVVDDDQKEDIGIYLNSLVESFGYQELQIYRASNRIVKVKECKKILIDLLSSTIDASIVMLNELHDTRDAHLDSLIHIQGVVNITIEYSNRLHELNVASKVTLMPPYLLAIKELGYALNMLVLLSTSNNYYRSPNTNASVHKSLIRTAIECNSLYCQLNSEDTSNQLMKYYLVEPSNFFSKIITKLSNTHRSTQLYSHQDIIKKLRIIRTTLFRKFALNHKYVFVAHAKCVSLLGNYIKDNPRFGELKGTQNTEQNLPEIRELDSLAISRKQNGQDDLFELKYLLNSILELSARLFIQQYALLH